MNKILIIEDDPAISLALKTSLTDEGYHCASEDDGEKGFSIAKNQNFDLILLDIILPSKNGFEICGGLRKAGVTTPIIIITSKKEEVDKVIGLELGADDYITKPFSERELLARIRANLRRASDFNSADHNVSFDDVSVDFKAHSLKKSGVEIEVTSTELKLLKFLVENENIVLTREEILNAVWGYDYFPTTRTVDNFILSLRKKIENDFSNPKHLLTVHRKGYKFHRNAAAL